MNNKLQKNIGRTSKLTAVLAAVFLVSGSVEAAQLVTFVRGQALVVQSAEKRNGWYFFTLEGGGEFGVPLAQVASVEEYEAPPPAAPASPAAPSSAVAATPPHTSPARPGVAALPHPGRGTPPRTGTVAPGIPGRNPGSPAANTMAPGREDWRHRGRMGNNRRFGVQNGASGVVTPGGRLPFGIQRPGMSGPQRRQPPRKQNPNH